jgi:hypothetical protein
VFEPTGGFKMKKMKWLVLFFAVLSFGCSPNNNNSEQLSTPQIDEVESFPSVYPLANYDTLLGYGYGRKMVPCVMTGYGVLERSSTFTGGSFFAVYVTVEEGYFGEEQYQNIRYFDPESPPK